MHKSIFLATTARCGTHWIKNVLLKLLKFTSDLENVTWRTADDYVDLIRKKEEKELGGYIYSGHIPIIKIISISMVNRIVIVRDPRDICVSSIFFYIMKGSPLERFDDSLIKMLSNGGPNPDFNRSYIKDKDKVPHYLIKFEDMVNDEFGAMVKLLNFFNYDYDPEKLKEALEKFTFKNLSGGREIGEEDIHNHYRKGIVGDWKNYLTEEMNQKFCERHHDLMETWGYEK